MGSDVAEKNMESIFTEGVTGIHLYWPSNVLDRIMPIYLVSPNSDLKQQKHDVLFPNKHLIGDILYFVY